MTSVKTIICTNPSKKCTNLPFRWIVQQCPLQLMNAVGSSRSGEFHVPSQKIAMRVIVGPPNKIVYATIDSREVALVINASVLYLFATLANGACLMPKSLAILILVASIAFAGSPLWVPEFGGFEPDQFPFPQLNAPVQPAGYAFAIWGPIFTWLVVAAVYGLWKRTTASTWSAMRSALLVSLAIGAAWLPVASLSPVWAAILIWLMLIPSVVALFRSPHEDQVWASWPIGLYAGWLSAASFAAIGLLLGGYGWTSELTAAMICVSLASTLGFTIQWRLGRAPTYGIAVVWALIAIAVANEFALDSVAPVAIAGALAMLWPVYRTRG